MCVVTNVEDLSFIEANTELTRLVAVGRELDEVLSFVYTHFHRFIPFERIGLSLVDGTTDRVSARWARSQFPVKLKKGYSAPLSGSSLALVLKRRCPRVLNDLTSYLKHRPHSQSTQLIVNEGFQSSLTVPLEVDGQGIGFLFFTSVNANAFSDLHVTRVSQIAAVISLCVLRHNEIVNRASFDGVTKPADYRDCIERARSIRNNGQQETAVSDAIVDSIHRAVSLDQLQPGMVFEDDVISKKGLLLYSAGHAVDDLLREQLCRYSHSGDAVCEPIAVICSDR